MDATTPADQAKRAAAARALEEIREGTVVGLGTGSTAAFLVDLLGQRVAAGFRVTGVPTSSRTRAQAEALDIPLTTLEEAGQLDLTIDGADEFDGAMTLVKGGGAALLQEKIVAASSRRMIVISDPSKEVATLGAFPLPVEVVRFGWQSTARRIAAMLDRHDVDSRRMARRMTGDAPLVTDEGHYLLDLSLGRIGDAARLEAGLNAIPGVVENGLFVGIASSIVVGHADGTVRLIGG
jgi:ribose 5-phosphate isomerase A